VKLIVTGATGMVGEGVLLEALATADVERVLVVARRSTGRAHPKLTELIVADFMKLDDVADQLAGYDGCLYCAGKTSLGMSEADYTKLTYDTPIAFARVLLARNPGGLVMAHVSGRSTDATEQGKVMWARVKGRAENALTHMGFKGAYNFRPALMIPTEGQKNVPTVGRVLLPVLAPLFRAFSPNSVCTLAELGRAMINAVRSGAPKSVLEVADIKALAART
jgi:uncharacterized protein YbjT (DUF2867 family)